MVDAFTWINLIDFAGMLELPLLASAARDRVVKLLDTQIASISSASGDASGAVGDSPESN
ncbi:hypothetical protein H9P43_007895 [Blastocladiella emersonii ATCC 22665]|nr:hypothetical protein H9P43_007895 [Blastocladiella emersonii ATCC 22665]